jgi:hypothetical protein
VKLPLEFRGQLRGIAPCRNPVSESAITFDSMAFRFQRRYFCANIDRYFMTIILHLNWFLRLEKEIWHNLWVAFFLFLIGAVVLGSLLFLIIRQLAMMSRASSGSQNQLRLAANRQEIVRVDSVAGIKDRIEWDEIERILFTVTVSDQMAIRSFFILDAPASQKQMIIETTDRDAESIIARLKAMPDFDLVLLDEMQGCAGNHQVVVWEK